MMGLTAPGLGSSLDVNSIVSQLMAVEAQPLTRLAKKEASFQAKLSAFGSMKSALSSFQSALGGLNTTAKFESMTTTTSDPSVAKATSTSQAAVGSYKVNVSRLAQAQTLVSAGRSSTTSTIGAGASTTLTFQFGKIEGGTFESAGAKLSSSVASGGIAANSLSINGTTVVTGTSTNSANALATQINLLTSTTGVTATAQATDTGSLGAFTATSGDATYTLGVGGVNIITNGAAGTDGAAIDNRLADATVAGNLSAAGISFTGSAAAGTLKFTRADGSNIAVQESGAGVSGGFTSTIGIGKTKTFTSSVSLSSASAITAGGNDPGLAGFAAGVLPNTYTGASFTQDASQASGTVTIDNTNNTLQGIRDAINKANIGVTATLVSDGSASPHRLVVTANKTGASSSMKIAVSGDAGIADLLAYDPAGTQKMTQTSAGQDAQLSVNGVATSSATNTVSDAIQGVTLTVSKAGASTISVARDENAVKAAVNNFVKAFNDADKTLRELSAYNAETKQGGPLVGDSTVRSIQATFRSMLTSPIEETAGSLKRLADVGVTLQKDGKLAVDSAKLQKAVTDKFDDIAALFAAVGKTTDSLVEYRGAGSSTKPGKYDVFVTSLATQGKIVGGSAAGLTITSGSNDKLITTVNGVTATVTLTAGTYDTDSLVRHVQSAINGASEFSSAGISVKASADANGIITVESNRYGSDSAVNIVGSGADSLLGTTRTTSAGTDVAGKIGGITAKGAGQELTAPSGIDPAGLRVVIKGGAGNTARGTVHYSEGYASQLHRLLEKYLASDGTLSSRTDGLNSSIKDLNRQREALHVRLQATEKRYRAQFVALDTLVSSMTRTSSYLQQQLNNLPKIE